MSGPIVIPTGGTVNFLVYPLDSEQLEVRVGGQAGQWVRSERQELWWRRPCVGLVLDDAPRPFTGQEGQSLQAVELVVDENGEIYRAHDYLHSLLGGAHWDHTATFFEPHVPGPVTSAPLMRIVETGQDDAEPGGT